MSNVEPYILRGRIALPPELAPTIEHRYDPARQLWTNASTGVPVVAEHNVISASKFGETSLTETREGADQSEVSALEASRFGETSFTKTHEGHDQGEALTVSRYGETRITATAEGFDAGESSIGLADAAHHHF